MRVPRRRFIAGAASGLIALSANPLGGAVRATPAVGPRLLLVGDSLTGLVDRRRQMREAIAETGLWSSVVVDGRNGRKIAAAVPLVAAHRSRAATDGVDAAYVVALGTNDLAQTWLNTPSARDAITTKIAAVIAAADGALVVWMNTSFSRRRPGYPGRARRFNAILAGLATTVPNLRIIDWYAAMPPASPRFTPDGIHLSSAAYRRRVHLTARLADAHAREFFGVGSV